MDIIRAFTTASTPSHMRQDDVTSTMVESVEEDGGEKQNGGAQPVELSILIGPQGELRAEDILRLRQTLLDTSSLNFLSTTIAGLPSIWPDVLKSCPDLALVSVQDRLARLRDCLLGDADPDTVLLEDGHLTINNTVLCPLTVIAHIVDFWTISRVQSLNGTTATGAAASGTIVNVQGFCLGFLTATAISSAKDEVQFQALASKAVRIALLLGAFIDADAAGQDVPSATAPAVAIAARWRTPAQWQSLEQAVASYPEAYISCVADARTVTIIVPAEQSTAILHDLSARRISAAQLAPKGNWHHSRHSETIHTLANLCQQDERFRLPGSAELNSTLLHNTTGQPITEGELHNIAIRSMLSETSRWDLMFAAETNSMPGVQQVYIGEKIIPSRVTHAESSPAPSASKSSTIPTPPETSVQELHKNIAADTAIAVVGMSCRYPDADSVEELWDIISEGRCTVRPMPTDRLDPSKLRHEPAGPFWGAFVRNIDEFDHRFFGVSAREAKSMDPQQRMCLSAAYQAMESAGYLGLRSGEMDQNVGCYIGVANDDYTCNVASHPVNAFAALGTLRAFIAGRISHFFDWEGPSLTIDTACSAAAVAIHTACRALQTGDCSIALAGGCSAMTSSRMTQNLAGAGFLSPTGASKAFDADADGYCRGEGVGMVVLRPLQDALRSGDFVLGVITGTALNQGGNCSSITVPDANSQRTLYTQALKRANVLPSQITYVEAHGTGTQVGDPIEFQSIRDTFGCVERSDAVFVGSIKDNIGHTEASSGVAALLKTLLMMQKCVIPKQANFKRLNPNIAPLSRDRIVIPTKTLEWRTASKRFALINNYGASGNNTALVLEEGNATAAMNMPKPSWTHYPILISAKTGDSLKAFCARLQTLLSADQDIRLVDVAYNLAIKQNRSMEASMTWISSSVEDLKQQLAAQSPVVRNMTQDRMVVLCFGGQDGRIAHISKELYKHCTLLQHHLADCELACKQELELQSVIFPAIFNQTHIGDVVTLHCVLFSIQYACARAWIDSGLVVDRLIGHSFGQLTALCVAGALSLSETVRLIVTRARLLQGRLDSAHGSAMLLVHGDEAVAQNLLRRAQEQMAQSQPGSLDAFKGEIACHNGPTNVVIAGDKRSIDTVELVASTSTPDVRVKRLQNTHAFHSPVMDAITPELKQAAETLHFKAPDIPVEACCGDEDDSDWSLVITSDDIVKHTRGAVHFMSAVRRIESRHTGPITWLEAGSGSPVIPMVQRAAKDVNQHHSYIATPLRHDANAQQLLADATSQLWANDVRTQFWPFHLSQATAMNWVNLPPYQFAKTKHWLEYRPPTMLLGDMVGTSEATTTVSFTDDDPRLIRPLSCCELPGLDKSTQNACFEVNTKHELYRLAVRGHKVVSQTLCPASMYTELALAAVSAKFPAQTSFVPRLTGLIMSSPLTLHPRGLVVITIGGDNSTSSWTFTLASYSQDLEGDSLTHGTGQVINTAGGGSSTFSTLAPLQNLLSQRCYQIESSPDAVGYRGPTVYRAFQPAVIYADYFHGIRSIYHQDFESAARIGMPTARPAGMGTGLADPVLYDCIAQVSGVLANCFSLPPGDTSEMWVCNVMQEIEMTSEFIDHARDHKYEWIIYSKYGQTTEKNLRCDSFVIDESSGNIVALMRGIEFQKVSTRSLARVLGKSQREESAHRPASNSTQSLSQDVQAEMSSASLSNAKIEGTQATMAVSTTDGAPSEEIAGPVGEEPSSTGLPSIDRTRKLISDMLEISIEDIHPDSNLADLGVDSLIAMELFADVKKEFGVKIPFQAFAGVSTIQDLADVISRG